ncbi:MAG: hypothetical protein ACREAW_02905, partial [Nitrososphaera sp.]
YDETDGSEIPLVSMWKVGEKIGTGGSPSIETQNIFKWLYGEGLARSRDIGGEIGITHDGIKEVEDARRNPNKDTPHFSPSIINNVFNNYGTMSNSPIQQGATDSVQNVNITIEQQQQLSEVVKALKEIVESSKELADDDKVSLQEDVNMLEIQAKSNAPNKSIIKTILSSAKEKLIKNGSKIVDGAIIAGKIGAFLLTLG